MPVGIGGDHLVSLAELRALAKVHGPLGLVHLDSHTDLWDTYNGLPYAHGTMFRRAIEEGVLEPDADDPARHARAAVRRGRRGDPRDARRRDGRLAELATLAPAAVLERVRARIGDGPTFCTFDIDFVDPAFAPGTGTPEVGGPSSHEALQIVPRARAASRSSATTSSRWPRSTTGRAR